MLVIHLAHALCLYSHHSYASRQLRDWQCSCTTILFLTFRMTVRCTYITCECEWRIPLATLTLSLRTFNIVALSLRFARFYFFSAFELDSFNFRTTFFSPFSLLSQSALRPFLREIVEIKYSIDGMKTCLEKWKRLLLFLQTAHTHFKIIIPFQYAQHTNTSMRSFIVVQ